VKSPNPTFEDWLTYCFDHPVSDPEWHFDIDAPTCDLSAETTVEYLTRLFTTSQKYLDRFSDDQLNQGLWYLASPSCSDTMFCLVDVSIPEAERIACVRAMQCLYANLFASRCSDITSNGTAHVGDRSALNSVCYMWWDILPIHGKPEDPNRVKLDDAILTLLEDCLAISSQACQESALHGLGHWASSYPARVKSSIQRYLAASQVSQLLRNYALAAEVGNVQ